MKALVNLPASMKDLGTATLVQGLDSSALPSQEQCIALIKSYIGKEGDLDDKAALASSRNSDDRNDRRSGNSRPGTTQRARKGRCYACRSTAHGVSECPDSSKKAAYEEFIKKTRGTSGTVSTLASARNLVNSCTSKV
jgi:hypothetical protein